MVFKKDDSVCLSHMTAISTSLTPHVSSETLHARSQNLANWTSQAMVPLSKSKWRPFFYRALDFVLTKAGKDSFSVEAGAKKKSLKL